MYKRHTIIISICVGLIATSSLFGQKKLVSDNETPSNCEYVRHALDAALYITAKTENSNVVFVFRTGSNENSRKVIEQRIKTIREHIKFRTPNFKRFLIIEGKKNVGLGKLEIYVKGKLEWELFAKKNQDFGYNCLEESY